MPHFAAQASVAEKTFVHQAESRSYRAICIRRYAGYSPYAQQAQPQENISIINNNYEASTAVLRSAPLRSRMCLAAFGLGENA